MPTDPRFIATKFKDFPVLTYQRDEHSCFGSWSRPKVPALVFSDSTHDGSPVHYYHGPLGGAGTPVQLIFWGAWWNGAGSGEKTSIELQTQALLASSYFSELAQYHIADAPTWGGSVTVATPGPPTGAVDPDVAMQRVVEMIEQRIDNGLFPDPDDGPRIAYIVLMPQGFSVIPAPDGGQVLGQHKADYTYDFPFDEDRYWAGWVRYYDPITEGGVESTMPVLGHELIEMLTDPEGDGWRRTLPGMPAILGIPRTGSDEIADWSWSTVGGAPVHQEAWVNDVRVQSYWSNHHGATVIPVDDDYAAQLRARVSESSRRELSRESIPPDPGLRAACKTIPACCLLAENDYESVVYAVSETARVRLRTVRYKSPKASWMINGVPISGSHTIELRLRVDGFKGRTPTSKKKLVKIVYTTNDTVLDLQVVEPGGNFDITIGCTVVDTSITGNVATNVIATPTVLVGFVGAELVDDAAYVEATRRCYGGMLAKYVEVYKPLGRIGPGDPINYDVTILNQTLPAYSRLSGYRQLRETIKLIRAADHLLDTEDAHSFIGHLLRAVPALSAALPSGDGRDLAEAIQRRPAPTMATRSDVAAAPGSSPHRRA